MSLICVAPFHLRVFFDFPSRKPMKAVITETKIFGSIIRIPTRTVEESNMATATMVSFIDTPFLGGDNLIADYTCQGDILQKNRKKRIFFLEGKG